jgi:diguanylate cyclase (GGDEF)-like protein
MEALNRIGGESAGVDVLMQRICDEIMQVCDASGAVVERADGSEMVYVCAAGSVAAHVGLRLPMAGSLSGLCVASRATQRCVDSENDPRVHREACRKVRARSMLLVPLLYGGEAIGVLKATSERLFAFGPDDEQLLRCCAGIIGAALGRELALEAERRHSAELAQALDASRADAERLGRDALCDALTGLPNRRRFDQEIDRLLDGERLAGGAALAFVDLNDFKSINDRYGHEAGDAALRAVADALRATLRVGDLAARLAGDEFVALLVGLGDDPVAHCRWFARKLLLAVAQSPVLVLGQRIAVSISIGLALHDRPGLDRSTWLARADAAMYRAKLAGPHCYCLHGDSAAQAAG